MKRTALPILSLSLALVWLAGILLGGCAPASPAPRPTVGTLPTSTPMLAQALTLPAATPSESPFPKNTPPPSPTNPHTATPSSATATPTHPPTPTSAHSPSPAPGALVAGSQSKPVPAKAVLSLSRGEYVTGSANPNEAEIAWMSRFRIVHAGGLLDPLPTDVIARLRQAGVQILLVYDWLPATYHYTDGESDDPLTQWLYDNRDWATLNPNGPFPHCTEEGYDWCEDYYFDLGDANVRQARVDYLVQTVHDLGYDGVFFDWSNSQFLDEDAFATIRETYETRHPDLPYAEAIALFYQALRDAGLIVQSNQGFRDAQAILPQVDYDMTESYGTTDETFGKRLRVEGQGVQEVPETVYYPVSDDPRRGTLQDTLDVVNWLESLRAYAGDGYRGVVYMNYAAPQWEPTHNPNIFRATMPKNAIYYGYALAKLVGEMGYTEVPWNHALERAEVYFYNLGRPLGATYQPLAQNGAVRYYTHGLALIGVWQHPTTLVLHDNSIPSHGWAYDPYTQTWLLIHNHTLRLPIHPEPDPVTGHMAPLGRIILYLPQP